MDPLLQALIVSASLGSLIGLERQWKVQHDRPDVGNLMGLRTFTLWALFGTLSAYVTTTFVPLFYLVAFGSLMLMLILSFVFDSERRGGFGFTTITAALLTFTIGSLVYWGQMKIAVILTICILILMESKSTIRDLTGRFTKEDVKTALQFAAMTGVILPLVPNQAYGLFDAFNPFSIWLMVVLVVGLGFVGYVAMRMLGANRGISVTGLIGGMVSSTATAWAFSRQSKAQSELSSSFAVAIIVAGTMMLVRVAVMLMIVNVQILPKLALPLLLMAIPGAYMGAKWWKQMSAQTSDALESKIKNPLSLNIAVKFAAIYVVIVFITKATNFYFHESGLLVVSFLSGFTSVSAIVLSLAQMVAESQITSMLAAKGIILAILSAMIFKVAVGFTMGSVEIRRPVAVTFGIVICLGILGFLSF